MVEGVAKLTKKQAAFLAEYLGNGGCGAAAYRAAYGSRGSAKTAADEAARLLKHPGIAPAISAAEDRQQAAIATMLDRYVLDQEAVIRKLCLLACCDVRDIFSWGATGIRIKPSAEITDEAAYAITEIRRSQGGALTIKLADKRAALMDLAKLRGWLTDKTQHLGPDGKPINPQAVTLVVVRR